MDDEGRIPTLRQAAVDLGVSHTAVAQLMTQLEKKGVLAREGRYGRTIRLYPDYAGRPDERRSARRGRELPIIGQVTAGLPMYAQQEWEGTVLVDPDIFPGDSLFCLRIKGRVDEGCRDFRRRSGGLRTTPVRGKRGDRRGADPGRGGDGETILSLYADHIELRPANDAFPVMCYPFGDLLVQGKVVGVIRGRHAEFDGKRRIATVPGPGGDPLSAGGRSAGPGLPGLCRDLRLFLYRMGGQRLLSGRDQKPAMLGLYGRCFSVVELNYTWYQMARAESLARMVEGAPPQLLLCRQTDPDHDPRAGRQLAGTAGPLPAGHRPAAGAAGRRAHPVAAGLRPQHRQPQLSGGAPRRPGRPAGGGGVPPPQLGGRSGVCRA